MKPAQRTDARTDKQTGARISSLYTAGVPHPHSSECLPMSSLVDGFPSNSSERRCERRLLAAHRRLFLRRRRSRCLKQVRHELIAIQGPWSLQAQADLSGSVHGNQEKAILDLPGRLGYLTVACSSFSSSAASSVTGAD